MNTNTVSIYCSWLCCAHTICVLTYFQSHSINTNTVGIFVLDFVVHKLNESWQISRVTQWIQTQLAFVVLDFGVHTLNVSWLISRVTQWIWTQTHIKFYISGAFGATEKRLVPNWREKSIPNINRDPDPQKNQTRLQSGFGIDKFLPSADSKAVSLRPWSRFFPHPPTLQT
jgi:hypothetical protein